jgi:uncharacterized protein YjiS (DUF1127 family)
MITKPLAALRRWMRDRSNRRTLAALDDHLLLDIGAQRPDVGRGTPGKLSQWVRT